MKQKAWERDQQEMEKKDYKALDRGTITAPKDDNNKTSQKHKNK